MLTYAEWEEITYQIDTRDIIHEAQLLPIKPRASDEWLAQVFMLGGYVEKGSQGIFDVIRLPWTWTSGPRAGNVIHSVIAEKVGYSGAADCWRIKSAGGNTLLELVAGINHGDIKVVYNDGEFRRVSLPQ